MEVPRQSQELDSVVAILRKHQLGVDEVAYVLQVQIAVATGQK